MKINITYRFKKSGISMRVTKSGDVNVSAPVGIPESMVMEFVHRHRDWIDSARRRMQDYHDKKDEFFNQLPLDTRARCIEASRQLDNIIRPLMEKYEELMGVRANGITYRSSKTRWGSCNTKTHHVNFSIYLLLLPDWCIEHVVVHELAHIIVPNHGTDFYAVMDKFFSKWREARAETRRISRMGKEDDDM